MVTLWQVFIQPLLDDKSPTTLHLLNQIVISLILFFFFLLLFFTLVGSLLACGFLFSPFYVSTYMFLCLRLPVLVEVLNKLCLLQCMFPFLYNQLML